MQFGTYSIVYLSGNHFYFFLLKAADIFFKKLKTLASFLFKT